MDAVSPEPQQAAGPSLLLDMLLDELLLKVLTRGEQATGYTGSATLFAWCPYPVRFNSEKQGVGLGWDNVLIAVRVWLNFRIPTVAFSGVDVSPSQCVRCKWVFGRFGVGRGDSEAVL